MSTAGHDGPGPPAWVVRRVAVTGSTNADLLADAAAGAPEGSVLVADHQLTGRGRLGRQWLTPPGSALAVSVLLRPPAATRDRLGWLPLLTGLAVLDALDVLAPGVGATLKWPNDLLVGSGDGAAKVAGVLAQALPGPGSGQGRAGAVVVGVGVNVSTPADELPAGVVATSLAAAGADVDRDELLGVLLARLGERHRRWLDGTDPLADLRARCSTLGRDVTVDRPGGALTGRAVDVDPAGRLLVCRADGTTEAVDAGDVTHLRT